MLLNLFTIDVLKINEVNTVSSAMILPLKEGEEFTIVYTHSVDLLPVYEIFYIDKGSIYLKETHFYNFGAGMGLLEGRGEYKEEDGILKITNINERIEPFILRTGPVARHRLLYRDREISFIAHFDHHKPLELKVETYNIIKYAFYRITGS